MKVLWSVAKSFITFSACGIGSAVAIDAPSGLVDTSITANENDEHRSVISKRKLSKKNGSYCLNELNEINRLNDRVTELEDHINENDDDGATYLYVQTGSRCHLEFVENEIFFHLKNDDDRTVKFTDRPFRDAGAMPSSTFISNFEKLFEGNYPNAAVTAVLNGTTTFGGPVVGVISQPKFTTSGAIRYHVAQEEGQDLGILNDLIVDNKLAFTTCSLFIDTVDEDDMDDYDDYSDADSIWRTARGLGEKYRGHRLPNACGSSGTERCTQDNVIHQLFASIINERVAFHASGAITRDGVTAAVNAEKTHLDDMYSRLRTEFRSNEALTAAQGVVGTVMGFLEWTPVGFVASSVAEIGMMVGQQFLEGQIHQLENNIWEEMNNYTQRIMARPQLAPVRNYYRAVDEMTVQMTKYSLDTNQIETHRLYAAFAEAAENDLDQFIEFVDFQHTNRVQQGAYQALVEATYHALNIDEDGDEFERSLDTYIQAVVPEEETVPEQIFHFVDMGLKCVLSITAMGNVARTTGPVIFRTVARYMTRLFHFTGLADRWATRFGRTTEEMSAPFRRIYRITDAFTPSMLEDSHVLRFMRERGYTQVPADMASMSTTEPLTEASFLESEVSGSWLSESTNIEPGEGRSFVAVEEEVAEVAEVEARTAARGITRMARSLGALTGVLMAGMTIFQITNDNRTLRDLDQQRNEHENAAKEYFDTIYDQFAHLDDAATPGCGACADGSHCCFDHYPHTWSSECSGCDGAPTDTSGNTCGVCGNGLMCCNGGWDYGCPGCNE